MKEKAQEKMKEKSVIIINEDHQFTVDGYFKPEDTVNLTFEEQIPEVADDTLVHTFHAVFN